MFKVIDIESFTPEGEVAIRQLTSQDSNEKVAACLGKYVPESILNFAKTAKLNKNCVYLHMIAMTAGDYYGPNRNGDYFSEQDLLGMQDQEEAAKNPGGVPAMQRYKTFLYASFYHHHKNKPDQGHPRFGKVIIAEYNFIMHRVELIIEVYRTNETINGIQYLGDPDTCMRAEKGLPIAFSMGCKVPGDYCSITGKFNKTVNEYGFYLKNMMGKILPDGRRVYAINKKPRFFDISKVTIPADPLGWSIQKVASVIALFSAEKAAEYGMIDNEKEADLAKKSEIKKVIPGGKSIGEVSDSIGCPEMECFEDDLSDSTLDNLGNLPLHNALSNLLASGILAKPHEMGKLIILRMGRSPDFHKEASDINWDASIDMDISRDLRKYAEKRAYYGLYAINRMEKLAALPSDELQAKAKKSLAASSYEKFNKMLPAGITLGALLAILYAKYRTSIRNGTIDQFFKLIDKNPIALPAAIAGGTAMASVAQSAFEKHANASMVNKMLLATAIPYIGHGYATEREKHRDLNGIEKVIKDHPGALALAANAAVLGLKKTAELGKMDLINNFVIGPMTSLSGSIPHSIVGGALDSWAINKALKKINSNKHGENK